MDALLSKVSASKDDQVSVTLLMRRKDITVDLLDYVNKLVDMRIKDDIDQPREQ
jgi:hypothetical protein